MSRVRRIRLGCPLFCWYGLASLHFGLLLFFEWLAPDASDGYSLKKLLEFYDCTICVCFSPKLTLSLLFPDPLAFRPNPSALASTSNSRAQAAGSDGDASDDDRGGKTGVYRPPKLVPVAYNEETARSRSKRGRDSSPIRGGRSSALLADLTAGLSSNPYEASSAGIGAARGGGSTRARALERMEQYEEDNFTRLVMSKKDAKRRRRDEEDVELGGAGLSSGKRAGRVGGGMEEEFGDLLRSAESGGGRKSRKASHAADAYNSLRKNAKRPSAFERAREGGASRGGDAGAGFEPGPAPRKKGRFEAAVKGMRRKGNK